MIRLAIAEHHTIVRWALREAFSKIQDITVVGDAGNVPDTLALVRREKPDVLLLDLAQPEPTYHLLIQLTELDSGLLTVMLAEQDETAFGARAVAAGAHALIRKSETPEHLLDAIRAVTRGERVVPPDVDALLAISHGHPAASLTTRELQVMEMIARGMTNREIAEDLEISNKTVDTHRGHILKKLSLRNNSELTRFAVRHGYVSA